MAIPNVWSVALNVSSVSSFEVIEEQIMHGVMILISKFVKKLLPSFGSTPRRFAAKPTAMIKNMETIFSTIKPMIF